MANGWAMKNLVLSLAFLMAGLPAYADEPAVVDATARVCSHGLKKQPAGGAFNVMLFCRDAAGSYIGIICNTGICQKTELPAGTKRFEAWNLADGMWQERIWASDVTSFAWSPDQKYVFVATDEIYGSGGLYQLDLERRKTLQLLPTDRQVTLLDPGPGYMIAAIAEDGSSLSYYIPSREEETQPPSTMQLMLTRK